MDYQIFRADRKVGQKYIIVYKKSKSFFSKERFFAKYFHNDTLHTIIDIFPEDVTIFCKMYETLFQIADRKPWHFNKDNMFDRLYPFILSNLYKSMWCNFSIFEGIDFFDDGTNFSLNTSTFHLKSDGDRCHLHLHVSKNTTSLQYQDFYNGYITREQGELFLSVIGIFVEQMGLIGWNGLPNQKGDLFALNPCPWYPNNNEYYLGNTVTFIDYYLNDTEYYITLNKE